MKNKTMLLLLVVPLLFACGNKGGNNPSSVNPGETSESSPTDTSTTSTNTDPSTSEEEPPVEPEVQTPEEMVDFPDFYDLNYCYDMATANEIMARAILNMDNCYQNICYNYDYSVGDKYYALAQMLPCVIHTSSMEEVDTLYSNGLFERKTYNDTCAQKNGYIVSKDEYIDETYYWYDNFVEGNATSSVYYEHNVISGVGSFVADLQQETITMLEDELKDYNASCRYNFFYVADFPFSLEAYFTYGFDGDRFVVEFINYSEDDYYLTSNDPFTCHGVSEFAYVFEPFGEFGYALVDEYTISYCYFLEDCFHNKLANPSYVDISICTRHFDYSLNELAPITLPTFKPNTYATISSQYIPKLSVYYENSGSYYVDYTYGFSRLPDVTKNDVKYAVYESYLVDVYDEYIYVVGNNVGDMPVNLNNVLSYSLPFRTMTSAETSFLSECAFAFNELYDDAYMKIRVLVDFTTGELILDEMFVI